MGFSNSHFFAILFKHHWWCGNYTSHSGNVSWCHHSPNKCLFVFVVGWLLIAKATRRRAGGWRGRFGSALFLAGWCWNGATVDQQYHNSCQYTSWTAAPHQPHLPHFTHLLRCWFVIPVVIDICSQLIHAGYSQSCPREPMPKRDPVPQPKDHTPRQPQLLSFTGRWRHTWPCEWPLWPCAFICSFCAVHNPNVSHIGFSVECGEPLLSSGSTHHWCWGRRLWHRAGTGRADRGLDIVCTLLPFDSCTHRLCFKH